MSNTIHPAAPHHLPGFITAPGETDVLFTGSIVFLIVLVLAMGSLYFWLHAIPERIAHGSSKLQFQLVAVLSLLALFTHNNAFWVAALLLALVPIPDFWTPLATMADSLVRMAGRRPPDVTLDETSAFASKEIAASPLPPVTPVALPGPPENAGNGAPEEAGKPSPGAPAEADGSISPVAGTEAPTAPAIRSGSRKRALSAERA